ncbi:DnaB-like helicase C-terminal domain-containing protein (plasmid) [Streptomyces uncialis]|uniref:replicative DNA helicase n=1 Tax=Streptomyces uncialis TaxID=1048205 RepID=UPI002E2EE12F|nr:DnaB-like helicase C-terminal domain-containing protein [Streptomyces uncialis]
MTDTTTQNQAADEPVSAKTSVIADLLENLLNDTADIVEDPNRYSSLRGLPTGFRDLDLVTGGLTPGSLTVIASRPQVGRTTLLTDICRNTAIQNNIPTAVYSLEETGEFFLMRVLAAEARVARHHIICGTMTDEDWARMARRVPNVSAAPLHVKTPGRLTMATLETEARELVEEHGVALLAVDGIQDIRPAKRSDLREREVGDVVRDLKTLARELNIPVVATSHLNRNPEQRYDRLPKLDDLRESGAITFAADTILLLHREDAYTLDTPRAGEADFYVAKHRQGPMVVITTAFQGHYGRFVDMAQT